MTSRNKHMKRSHRSYKNTDWQTRFRRLAWVREYDNNIKTGAVERVKNFIKAAARKHKGTIDETNENE